MSTGRNKINDKFDEVYRQLGDSNSQWHKKIVKSASWGEHQVVEVPVGGQKFSPWTDDFFPYIKFMKI